MSNPDLLGDGYGFRERFGKGWKQREAEIDDWERCEKCGRQFDADKLDPDGNCEECADELAILADGKQFEGD